MMLGYNFFLKRMGDICSTCSLLCGVDNEWKSMKRVRFDNILWRYINCTSGNFITPPSHAVIA